MSQVRLDAARLAADGEALHSIAQSVSQAVRACESALGGTGGMAGDDESAEVFAHGQDGEPGYDQYAVDVLKAALGIANSLRVVDAALGNSGRAYDGAQLVGAFKSASSSSIPEESPTIVPPSASVSTALGKGPEGPLGEFGDFLKDALATLGVVLPSADRGKLSSAESAWSELEGSLSSAQGRVSSAFVNTSAMELPQRENILGCQTALGTSLESVAKSAGSMAGFAREMREAVDKAWEEIGWFIAQMAVEIALEIGIGALLGAVTFGAGAAAMAAKIMFTVTRWALKIAALCKKLRTLIMMALRAARMAIRGGIRVAREALSAGLASGITTVSFNTVRGALDPSYQPQNVLTAALSSAVGGAAGGMVSGAGGRITSGVGNTAIQRVTHVTVETGSGAVDGLASGYAESTLNGQPFSPLSSMAAGALLGGALSGRPGGGAGTPGGSSGSSGGGNGPGGVNTSTPDASAIPSGTGTTASAGNGSAGAGSGVTVANDAPTPGAGGGGSSQAGGGGAVDVSNDAPTPGAGDAGGSSAGDGGGAIDLPSSPDSGGVTIDGPSADAPSIDAPSAPSTDAPSAPGADAPSAPSADAPSAPSTDAPAAPGADAPSAPSVDAPSAPGADAPSAPSVDAPSAPSTDAPSAPSADAPAVPGADSPSAPAADAPTPGADAPSAPASDAPSAPATDAPTAPSADAPSAPSADAPATSADTPVAAAAGTAAPSSPASPAAQIDGIDAPAATTPLDVTKPDADSDAPGTDASGAPNEADGDGPAPEDLALVGGAAAAGVAAIAKPSFLPPFSGGGSSAPTAPKPHSATAGTGSTDGATPGQPGDGSQPEASAQPDAAQPEAGSQPDAAAPADAPSQPDAADGPDADEADALNASTRTIEEIDAALTEINPNFDWSDPSNGFATNCGHTSSNLNDFLTGHPASEAPGGSTLTTPEMEARTGNPQTPMTPEAIEASLRAMGPGSHCVVGIDRSTGDGHWFNAYFDGDQVWTLDAQTGTRSPWPPHEPHATNWDASIRPEHVVDPAAPDANAGSTDAGSTDAGSTTAAPEQPKQSARTTPGATVPSEADGGPVTVDPTTPWDPSMGEPANSGATHGPGWDRVYDRVQTHPDPSVTNPIDPDYGDVRGPGQSGHLLDQFAHPGTVPGPTAQLVTDPGAPYGRADDGTPYTRAEWESRYTDANGRPVYPGNDGAAPGSIVRFTDLDAFRQQYGDHLDRMGNPWGGFMSLPGTPFEHRALPPSNLNDPYAIYELSGTLPPNHTVEVSVIEAAFGHPGGGLQVRVLDGRGDPLSVDDLVTSGVLLRTDVDAPSGNYSPAATANGGFATDSAKPHIGVTGGSAAPSARAGAAPDAPVTSPEPGYGADATGGTTDAATTDAATTDATTSPEPAAPAEASAADAASAPSAPATQATAGDAAADGSSTAAEPADASDATDAATPADPAKPAPVSLPVDPSANASGMAPSDVVQLVAGQSVNPNFTGDPHSPFSVNCGSTSSTLNGILRGGDPAAQADTSSRDVAGMEADTGVPQLVLTPDQIEATLLHLGPGSHTVVGVVRNTGMGHWFVAYNHNGTVVTLDPQVGMVAGWPPAMGDVRFGHAGFHPSVVEAATGTTPALQPWSSFQTGVETANGATHPASSIPDLGAVWNPPSTPPANLTPAADPAQPNPAQPSPAQSDFGGTPARSPLNAREEQLTTRWEEFVDHTRTAEGEADQFTPEEFAQLEQLMSGDDPVITMDGDGRLVIGESLELETRCPDNCDAVEMDRQFDEAEGVLNGLSVTDWMDRRVAFINQPENYRDVSGSLAAQKATRDEWITNRIAQLRAADPSLTRIEATRQARADASTLNATHRLDMVAGGDPTDISGMGGGAENQAIGGIFQRDFVPQMEAQVLRLLDRVPPSLWSSIHMNVTIREVS